MNTTTKKHCIRIGTRGSPLALAQAEETRTRLLSAHSDMHIDDITIVVIKTTGDRILDKPLAQIGGKGLFTKEIEVALLAGDIDIAVHSMKDMPTVLPRGLEIGAYLPREEPWDAFMSLDYASLNEVPAGSVIGTASLRRQAQVLYTRPDLIVESLRGNVQTRMLKLATTHIAATYLAIAGLKRLNMYADIRAPQMSMLPALAQGAIGIENRIGDISTQALLAPLHHHATNIEVTMERAFLKQLDGSCRTPVAGLARYDVHANRVSFTGQVLSPDGQQQMTVSRHGTAGDAVALGIDAAQEILTNTDGAFWHEH